ncbi:MAG TPA: putative glycoside hydrolase [Vicinamibacterales bacterium]|nr:putative glycoside hydrolase [Vicinamibacterales bacterium]
MIRRILVIGIVMAAAMIGLRPPSSPLLGVVIDARTHEPVADATVTVGSAETRTDARGMFRASDAGAPVVRVRAYGYGRAEVAVDTLRRPPAEVRLVRVRPKALYLSVFGVGNRTLREAALGLLDTTELNALVIDVKGDRGLIGYRSSIALAEQVGAQRVITMPDLPGLLSTLRQRGIYTIARIVAFKDDPLATARPGLAVHRRDGSIYRDREGLAWTDPHDAEVRAYNIGVAREAAEAGFDEIQFDYARLPDATGLVYREPDTMQNRVAAIDGFLREARTALVPYNVFLAIDIFGYVCWNPDDTGIGQQLQRLAEVVDYVSPMLYPSSFQFGIPGYRNPVEHPYEIVRRSLEQARERTGLPPVRFRPWLQAFPDYAFGGRSFTGGEVRAQIEAAESFGTNGWMLWNPHNRYSRGDVRTDDEAAALAADKTR